MEHIPTFITIILATLTCVGVILIFVGLGWLIMQITKGN